MINYLKTIIQFGRIQSIMVFRLFLFLLVSVFFSKNVNSTSYFQEVSRVTLGQLAEAVDLKTTFDGQYIIVATGGENSTIQVYQQKVMLDGALEIEPVSIISEDNEGRLLTGLSSLLTVEGNRVYGISENNQKHFHGCQLSEYDIENNGTLTPRSGLFIPLSGNPPFQKGITGTKDSLFLNCQNTIVSVDLNGSLTQKDTLLLPDSGVYPASLVYFDQLKKLFISFFSNDLIANHDFGQAYINQNGKLQEPESIKINKYPDKGGFSSIASLLLPKYLLIYVYLFKMNSALIITFNAEFLDLPEAFKSLDQLKMIDYIPSKNNDRLFYSSEAGRLGVLDVNTQGDIGSVLDTDTLQSNYQKLTLTNDSCQIIAMAKADNHSGNGTLVLYRINDLSIGCGSIKHNAFVEIMSITASGLFLFTVTVGLIASYLCHRIRKHGARKGYIPVGEPDY